MRIAHSSAVLVAAVGLSLPASAIAQQTMDDVEIRSVYVANGVYMLQGRGGNIGLSVGEDGPFLVDDQFAPLTAKIQAAVAAVSEAPVRFVLNTHWHGDHTGGNENFGEAGAMIVAHENVRARLNPEEFRDVMGRTQQAPPEALPVVTFTDAVTFYWNGERIHALHVEHAHTDGDAVVFFTQAKVVHMGDVFFNGSFPFIDVESGGHVDGVIHAVSQVISMVDSDTQIIPGHGELADIDDLRAYRNMLMTVRDRVQLMINDGRSVDDVVMARPTANLDGEWTGNAGRFVRAVYQGLSQ
jgi:glyoxylase-like metal-dependent hydrolase (beta-lactamase superfamily II)